MYLWGFAEFQFQVINTGRVNMRNSWVQVEGPFDTSESNMFLSTLNAGRTITYTGRIRPMPGETGQLEGAIVVFGYDDADDRTEIRHEFTIYVMDDMGGDFGFDDEFHGGFPGRDDGWLDGGGFGRPGFDEWGEWGDEDDEGGVLAFIRQPIFFGPVLGVIAIAIIVTIVLMRRKKSKLSFDDDVGFN